MLPQRSVCVCASVCVEGCIGSYIFMNKALLLCKFQPLHFDYFRLCLYGTQPQHRGYFKPPPQWMILHS